MSRTLIGFLLLAALGCGRGIDEGKKPAAAANAEKVVLEKPDTPPAPPARPTVFAVRDLVKVLNLAKLPAIAGAEFTERSSASVRATVPGTPSEVAAFYTKNFEDLGWKPLATDEARPIKDDYGSMYFAKEGHVVNLNVSGLSAAPREAKQPRTRVGLTFHGNLDARTLPKPRDAVHSFGSPWLSAYFTEVPVATEAESVTRSLVASGWQEFQPLDSARLDSKESTSLSFRKQGYLLEVYLANVPSRKSMTNVTYSIRTLAHEIPTPPDSRRIEFADDRWKLHCDTARDRHDVAEFYRRAMREAGNVELPSPEKSAKNSDLLFRTPEDDEIRVRILEADMQPTRVRVEGTMAAAILAQKELERKIAEKVAQAAKVQTAKAPVTMVSSGKTESAESLPLPKNVREIRYDAEREEIAFRSPEKVMPLVEQLRETFAAANWKEDAARASVNASSALMVFRNDKRSLRVLILPTGQSGESQVLISTTGLEYKKSGR